MKGYYLCVALTVLCGALAVMNAVLLVVYGELVSLAAAVFCGACGAANWYFTTSIRAMLREMGEWRR